MRVGWFIAALLWVGLSLPQAEACICCTYGRAVSTTNAPPPPTLPAPSLVLPGSPETTYASCYSNRFDRAHHHVSCWVELTAQKLDGFLTGVITDEDDENAATNPVVPPAPMTTRTNVKPSYVTASPSITYGEEKGLQFRGRFKAHINLPSLKNRVQLIANNVQDDEDVLEDVTDPISRERRVSGENDKLAGLRVLLVDRMDFDLSASANLRFKPEPVPKIKLKARVRTELWGTQYELCETGFWQSDEGFGEKTEIIITRIVRQRLTLRSTSAALLEEEVDGMTFGETLFGEYRLRPRRTIGVTFGVEWKTEPAAAVDHYSLRFPYRQGIWRDWMYFRIEPGADFPNDENYDMNPLITIGVDIRFGNAPYK